MEPFERLKKTLTEGNLWIYILFLTKDQEVQREALRRLVFEKFGFLPGNLLFKRVLFRLKNQGFIRQDKLKGKKSYIATKEGKTELEKMKNFCQELLEKISEKI